MILVVLMMLLRVVTSMQQHVLKTDHNIGIDIDRSPSLTPDSNLLKIGQRFAISSDLELCNNMTLQRVFIDHPGSNAVDAAVTVALCIGMINFFNSGVGGGGFSVVSVNNTNAAFDFREMAPLKSNETMFDDNTENGSIVGGLSIAVPGELQGLYDMWLEFGSGKIAWSEILQPVIDLGYQGWEVEEVLGASLGAYEYYLRERIEDWEFVFNEDGSVKQKGDWISRPNLAKTLEILAKNGSVAPFYDPNSSLVNAMVSKIQEHGGILTTEDFSMYKSERSEPLMTKIRSGFVNMPNNDLTVLTSSGSSSGAALISALKIMDAFPSSLGGDYLPEEAYRLIEGMKWLSSSRSRLGDYGGGDELPPRIQELFNDTWINNAIRKIKENSVHGLHTLSNWTEYNPVYEINEPHGTAHFSVVDDQGNAVSLTTTVNLLFGSLVHDPVTGVLFNDEMDDFSQSGKSNSFGLAASVYNYIQAGKRPLSSAVPTIVLNELGHPDLVIGASGGSRICTSVFQAIIRRYWYQMPLLETISYPRVHHQLLPDILEIESDAMIGKSMIKHLHAMGHNPQQLAAKAVINGIQRCQDSWHAVSDFWRKRGIAAAL